jgi:hypothetical protein
LEAIFLDRRRLALLQGPQPVGREGDTVELVAGLAEGMDVGVSEEVQSRNSMPSLNVALDFLMTSFSSMPSTRMNSMIGGIVASPTPIVPICSDSTSLI